jgi:hypothetical protein
VLDLTQDPENTYWANFSAGDQYPQDDFATLDLATAINPTAGKAWFAAFWPSLSDWTIDGWGQWWRSMGALDPHDIDATAWGVSPREEPSIPYYIGEWDVEMKPVGRPTQQVYRFVTVYGVTDLWNGNDADQPTGGNVIDNEVMYQVNEVFNPWDLLQAVHKKNTRHVWIDDVTAISHVDAADGLDEHPFLLADWDAYCTFSERVLLDGELLVPQRAGRSSWDYYVVVDDMGYGQIWFRTAVTGHLKILYSTDTEWTEYGSIMNYLEQNVTYATNVNYGFAPVTGSFVDPLGATHSYSINGLNFNIMNTGQLEGNETATFSGELHFSAEDFKVWK